MAHALEFIHLVEPFPEEVVDKVGSHAVDEEAWTALKAEPPVCTPWSATFVPADKDGMLDGVAENKTPSNVHLAMTGTTLRVCDTLVAGK